jgi:hypothetical protein
VLPAPPLELPALPLADELDEDAPPLPALPVAADVLDGLDVVAEPAAPVEAEDALVLDAVEALLVFGSFGDSSAGPQPTTIMAARPIDVLRIARTIGPSLRSVTRVR